MRILAIGDIVGENGVRKLKQELPRIRQEKNIDFVIVNAENSAGGMGITTKIFEDLLDLNVDAITMGNHTWGKKDIFSFIDHPKLLRPANYSKGVVGKGLGIYECKNKKIAVINLIGRTDMNVLSENPFTVANDLVNQVIGDVDMIFIDFHAEATAEKIAMGLYLDGKITALYGTHTHVQTRDYKVLPNGTAFISDVGMTGLADGVLGFDKDTVVNKLMYGNNVRFDIPNEGKGLLSAVVLDVDELNGKCKDIFPIYFVEK